MDKTTSKSRRSRLAILAVAGLAVVSMSAGAMSLALFTDTETDNSTFTTGSIILDAAKIDAFDVTTTNMMPGDVVSGTVDVENDGTSTLRYSLDTTTTSVAGPNGGVLNSGLTIAVREEGTDCATFDGALLNASATEVLGASNVMFGNPSQTIGTGDITVAAAATHVLCVQVTLPILTGNDMQGASATTTFTFDAEQVDNNP